MVDGLTALLTLAFLEIVLGVDNIIFISIVSNKLPKEQQAQARNIGLLLALVFRIGLLLGITWIIKFTQPLFTIEFLDFSNEISGRDLILAIGALFLLAKSTSEIHHKIEGKEETETKKVKAVLSTVILQIVFLDIIFSFDSVLTAVGLTDHVELMIAAIIILMVLMLSFAGNRCVYKRASKPSDTGSFLPYSYWAYPDKGGSRSTFAERLHLLFCILLALDGGTKYENAKAQES